MQMIKRAFKQSFCRQQHAVAKHIARHVADAYDTELFLQDIDAAFSKISLHRNPCALRGNSHRFVVVAIAST